MCGNRSEHATHLDSTMTEKTRWEREDSAFMAVDAVWLLPTFAKSDPDIAHNKTAVLHTRVRTERPGLRAKIKVSTARGSPMRVAVLVPLVQLIERVAWSVRARLQYQTQPPGKSRGHGRRGNESPTQIAIAGQLPALGRALDLHDAPCV